MRSFLSFIAGAAIGAVVAWQYTKRYYEIVAQEEIDSVKKEFGRASEDVIEETEPEPTKEEKQDYDDVITQMKYKANEHDYTSFSESKSKEARNMGLGEPYIITPEEYGEIDEYSMDTLYYFSDHYLTDDQEELIDDIEDVVGYDNLKHIEKYERDAIHIRNERLKADYEVLQREERYADILKKLRNK